MEEEEEKRRKKKKKGEEEEEEAVLVTIQVFLDVTACRVVNNEGRWQIHSAERNFPIDSKTLTLLSARADAEYRI
jgi:hypothetical protein